MKKLKEFVVYIFSVIFLVACGTDVSLKDISVTGADGTVYNSYQTACSKGDFDAARDYIGKMKEKFITVKADGDYDEIKAFEEAIKEAEAYIENEELQFLASMNEAPANNRIILILNQRPIVGLEAAENACLGKKVYQSVIQSNVDNSMWSDDCQTVTDFKRYIIWCGEHNSKCTSLLNIAIACGNQNLAKKMIHIFRPDPELLTKEIKGERYYFDVYAHYTNVSKNAAQKKYDEAVKSGAFN